MQYQSGKTVEVGDAVRIENGKTPGVVIAIAESDVDMSQWNVQEPGLFIEAKPFGLVFWPLSDDDPVLHVASGESE